MTVKFRPADAVPPKDEPPRRGPGRPKGSGTRSRSTKSLRQGIDGLLIVINTVVGAVRPVDALDGVEIATLGKAIEEQAKQSPRFRRGIESLVSVTGGTSLIPVVAIIVARRGARHGMIPQAADPIGSVILQMMQAEPSEAQRAMDDVMRMMGAARGGSPAEPTDDTAAAAE